MAKLSPLMTVIQEHKYTVPGLLAAISSEVQRLTEKKGACLSEKEKEELLKQVSKEAFVYTKKSYNPPLTVAVWEEAAVVSVLLGALTPLEKKQAGEKLVALAEPLKRQLPAMRPFAARLQHSSSGFTCSDLNRDDTGPARAPYLYSRTLANPVRALHVGNTAADSSVIRLLAASFVYEGRITSFAGELVEEGSSFFRNIGLKFGLTLDFVEELRAAYIGHSAEFQGLTATIQWPTDDDEAHYAALSPIPSAQVLDDVQTSLARRYYAPQAEQLSRVSASMKFLGGSKPQNCGLFNNAVQGKHLVFHGGLYFGASRADRQIWRPQWIQRVPRTLALRFAGYTPAANRASRETFFSNMAQLVMSATIGNGARLHAAVPDALAQAGKDNAELQRRLAKNILYSYLENKTEEGRELLVGAIVAQAVSAGAAILSTDEDALKMFKKALDTQISDFDVEAL